MKSYFVLNFDISEKLPSFRSWEPSLALSMSVKFVWDSDSLELDCWYEKLLIFVLNFDISVFSENSGEFWIKVEKWSACERDSKTKWTYNMRLTQKCHGILEYETLEMFEMRLTVVTLLCWWFIIVSEACQPNYSYLLC